MTLLQAVWLGIVQGITEFLPVSSSGHLVLFQHLFGLRKPELLFNIAVHLGTLAAVVLFFRRDLAAMATAGWHFVTDMGKQKRSLASARDTPEVWMIILIIVGTIPTAILGLFFRGIADRVFASVSIVGVMLLITGALLWATRWVPPGRRSTEKITVTKALIIGLIQGLAILPGISRSGSTIAVGLFLGLGRETAARFSFLLSIVAVTAAGILETKNLVGQPPAALDLVLIGAGTAAVVGYLSLKLLVYVVRRGRLYYFAPYCVAVGLIAIWRALIEQG